MEEFKIYKVINSGDCYSTYSNFLEHYRPDLIEYHEWGGSPDTNGHRYYVLGMFNHLIRSDRKVAIIQDIQTRQVYIMDPKGIKEAC